MSIYASILAPFKRRLGYRVAVAASLPALMFLAILGGFTYWQIYERTYEQLVASVEFHANSEAFRVAVTLNTVDATIETLSENSTIANGLIDSAGRETYLTPLLEGFSTINGVKVELALADFLGTIIAASDEAEAFSPFKENIIAAIEEGKSQHIIFYKDGMRILFGIDVLIYSRTESGEGALVYFVNIDKTFNLFTGAQSQFSTQLIHKGDARGTNTKGIHFAETIPDSITIVRPVPLKASFPDMGLSIAVEANAAETFHPLQQISIFFLVGSGVILVLVIVLSLWLGREITRPLQRLRTTLDNASTHNSPDLDDLLIRQDEVGSLARSFRKVFTNLNKVNETLEQTVEERTKEYQKAKNEAETANQVKSDFLAAMSHDLRTPLNAIMGFSDMMQTKTFGPLGDAHYEQYALDIYDSGALLVSLINDILDLSKIEAGKYKLAEETLDISTLVQISFRQLNKMAETSNVTLFADIPPGTPALRGDGRAMTQILNNLLSNAIKFTPKGGEITVNTKLDENKGIVLSVTDTGIGMTQSGIAKSLQPFEQAEGIHSHRSDGTGLGLHLCKNLMKLFGGDLAIESTVDKGTTVTLYFPPERTIG